MTTLPYSVWQHKTAFNAEPVLIATFLAAADAYNFIRRGGTDSHAVHAGQAMIKRSLVLGMSLDEFLKWATTAAFDRPVNA